MLTVWREITIPAHQGMRHLLVLLEQAGMYVEVWAKGLVLVNPFPQRVRPVKFKVGRVSNLTLGFNRGELVSIRETKSAGLSQGLGLLDVEKILALRLAYKDQKVEWMRIAMETFIDPDGSWLDLVIVNDGTRKDIRTNWAFPQNQFQSEHEWFWEVSTL